MQRELVVRGALDALVTACDCLGPCFDGPNAVIYPDGAWYAGLEPADAAGLVDHLVGGRPLASKISERPGAAESADPQRGRNEGSDRGSDEGGNHGQPTDP